MAKLTALLSLLLVLLQLALEAPEVDAEPYTRGRKGFRRINFKKGRRMNFSERSTASCNCILLQECPSLRNLLVTDSLKNRQTIRAAICGFQGTKSKVCCPDSPQRLPDNVCGEVKVEDQRFVGRVTQPGVAPWLALLGYKEPGSNKVEFLCGGAVITYRHVLTAGHCVDKGTIRSRSLVTVRVGEHSIDTLEADLCPEDKKNHPSCRENHVDLQVAGTVIHPLYRHRSHYAYDLAIVKVEGEIKFNDFVQPICVPGPSSSSFTTALTTESGWSLEHEDPDFGKLDVVYQRTLRAFDINTCNSTYNGNVMDHMMCARPRRGSPFICLNASGGMVTLDLATRRYSLVGVPAFGHSSCREPSYPDVFISVSHFRNWIQASIRQ